MKNNIIRYTKFVGVLSLFAFILVMSMGISLTVAEASRTWLMTLSL